MLDLYISWEEYYKKIEHMAVQIHQSDWHFNQIVCLARGGLRIGDVLSRLFQKPLAILAASSYSGAGDRVRGKLCFAKHLTMTCNGLGTRILLVDDLVDSGRTLQEAIFWLQRLDSNDLEEIRTAVLWHKGCSAIAPDYCVDYLPDSPWIHQPFERYEQCSPADLAATQLAPCTAPGVRSPSIPQGPLQ